MIGYKPCLPPHGIAKYSVLNGQNLLGDAAHTYFLLPRRLRWILRK